MDIAATLKLAAGHMQAGQYSEAERLYRMILSVIPDEPNALYGLGFTALVRGACEEAIRFLSAAVRRLPRSGHAFLHLGDAYRYTGKLDDAMRAYKKAAKLLPGDPTVHNNLGAALQQGADYQGAVFSFRRAVNLAPEDPQFLTNLGAALHKLGQNEEAIISLKRALSLAPDHVPGLLNLGNVLMVEGKYSEACASIKRALTLQPDSRIVRDSLGAALLRAGRAEEAVACLEQDLTEAPTPLTYQELVKALMQLQRLTEAERHAREGAERFPGEHVVFGNLGDVLQQQGRLEESIAVHRHGQALSKGAVLPGGGIAFLLNALPCSHDEQKAATLAAASALEAKPIRPGPLRPRHPEKRLRIGYVSPDFRAHSVAYFFLNLIAHHDRSRVEVVCYHASFQRDAMTDQIRARADRWVDIAALDADSAARRIQSDRIDILVDLAGHTGGNRLDVFARRPAPLQVTYLGYPNSTGLTTMDYRITDTLADPVGLADDDYTETLIRLPRIFLAFSAPPGAPEVAEPPSSRGQALTFGSFNAIHKLSDVVLELWAKVLHALPDSRLLLKTSAFADDGVMARIRAKLESLGIAPGRLTLLGYEKERSHHLAIYERVDIALDSFPYGGTTTTCEAMYMGVPVITLAGDTHASRVGVSLMNAVGLPELVADKPQAFVEIAKRLADDRQGLADLRRSLRQRMEDSPLMDGAGLARAIETAYREIWRKACVSWR